MKKILLSLFVGLIGITSFCSSLNISDFIEYIDSDTVTVPAQGGYLVYNLPDSSHYGTYCVKVTSLQGNQGFFGMTNGVNNFNNDWFVTFYEDWSFPLYVCTYSNLPYITFYGRYGGYTVSYELFKLNTLLNTSVPVMTSLECQTEYNLIPIDDVNSNYCEINGLCPACPEGTGVGFSNFYVKNGEGNWNELSGTENYFIYIPEFLGYNFDYSNQGRDLDFTVGVGVDTGSVQSVIDINSYRPTSEDFTNVFVSGLTLVMPYIVIVLFIIFVRKLLKRIFK